MSELRQRRPTKAENDTAGRNKEEEDEVLISVIDVLRMVLGLVVLVLTLSYYVTGTLTWGVETRWTNLRYVKFRLTGGSRVNLTDDELALYNGRDSSLPIYVAINGSVFDVSSNPMTYGPGGPYEFFSGTDAARAFVTGCFRQDLTYDLRGIDENVAKAAIQGWQNFFSNSHKYWYVGTVNHPPLTGDPPEPCDGMKMPK